MFLIDRPQVRRVTNSHLRCAVPPRTEPVEPGGERLRNLDASESRLNCRRAFVAAVSYRRFSFHDPGRRHALRSSISMGYLFENMFAALEAG